MTGVNRTRGTTRTRGTNRIVGMEGMVGNVGMERMAGNVREVVDFLRILALRGKHSYGTDQIFQRTQSI